MTAPGTEHDIVTTVTQIAAAELGVSAASLCPDADLKAIEGMDSVKVLRMVAKIEHAYDIELEDEVVFGVSTIAGTAAAVRQALEEQAPGEPAPGERA
jgi:acyl carrier protein